MVQVRANQPINTDGSINLDAWLDHIVSVDLVLDREVMKKACGQSGRTPANAAPEGMAQTLLAWVARSA